MYSKIFFILFISIFSISAQAQTDSTKKVPAGNVIINADPQLFKLIDKRRLRRLPPNSKVDGFKIMIFFSRERSKAQYYKDHFNNRYGDKYPSELIFDEPNFKVYVGRFYKKEEANKLYNQIKDKYPNVIIIKDKVPRPTKFDDETISKENEK